MRFILLLLFVVTVLCSCVSKAKYKELGTRALARVTTLRDSVRVAESEIYDLRTALLKSDGGNTALLATQDKLQARIDELQAEIADRDQKLAISRVNLGGRETEWEAERKRLTGQIEGYRSVLAKLEQEATAIAAGLRSSLTTLIRQESAFYLESNANGVVLGVRDEVLFRANSAERLTDDAAKILTAIEAAIRPYPLQNIEVIGHTDNQPIPRRGVDARTYTALRAAAVVEYMTGIADVGGNRLAATGMGAFAPRASNEDVNGRAANRRVEFLIRPAREDVNRSLQQAMKQ